jgi:hypothetical protein
MLKFYAKSEHLVHRPGTKMVGQVSHYVGRRFVRLDDAEGKKAGTAGKHAALREPAMFADDSPEAPHLIRYAQKGGLWPADAETAAAVGVPFTKVQFDEQQAEWVPAVDKPKSTSKAE